MNLKAIEFQEETTKRIYDNYMKRTQNAIRTLETADQRELLMEFNSHIYEGLQVRTQGTEVDQLLDILDKLGNPEETLKPIVADKKLEQATQSFNPLQVFRALVLNIGNGMSYIVFFILYILLFGFVYLIIAKIFNPSQVGLFLKDGSFHAYGSISQLSLSDPGITEQLGHWFIPVTIVLLMISYLIITTLLRVKQNLNKRYT